MLLEKLSPNEVVFTIETRDGDQYDLLMEIHYDKDAGFHYSTAFFHPHSSDKLRKSAFPVALQIELSSLADAEYRQYMRFAEPELTDYLCNGNVRGVS